MLKNIFKILTLSAHISITRPDKKIIKTFFDRAKLALFKKHSFFLFSLIAAEKMEAKVAVSF